MRRPAVVVLVAIVAVLAAAAIGAGLARQAALNSQSAATVPSRTATPSPSRTPEPPAFASTRLYLDPNTEAAAAQNGRDELAGQPPRSRQRGRVDPPAGISARCLTRRIRCGKPIAERIKTTVEIGILRPRPGLAVG